MMSGEDLCNVGPVALQQDLAVMAALGIADGGIALGTINRAPLGVGFEVDLSECAPVAEVAE